MEEDAGYTDPRNAPSLKEVCAKAFQVETLGDGSKRLIQWMPAIVLPQIKNGKGAGLFCFEFDDPDAHPL